MDLQINEKKTFSMQFILKKKSASVSTTKTEGGLTEQVAEIIIGAYSSLVCNRTPILFKLN